MRGGRGKRGSEIENTSDFSSIYEHQIKFFATLGASTKPPTPAPFSARTIETLRKAAAKGRLAIVLGAGVSIPYKLPDWNSLSAGILKALFGGYSSRTIRALIKTNNSTAPILTRFLENESQMRAMFRVLLKEELYGRFDKAVRSATLTTIAKLLDYKYTRRPISKIISYNFDDLLEQTISRNCKTLAFSTIDSTLSCANARHRVKIFHPHGYLPANGNEDFLTSTFVFSEKEYHYQTLQRDYWSNAVQRELFSSHTCLFVGL